MLMLTPEALCTKFVQEWAFAARLCPRGRPEGRRDGSTVWPLGRLAYCAFIITDEYIVLST